MFTVVPWWGVNKIDQFYPLREKLSVVQVFLPNCMEYLKNGAFLNHPEILRQQHSNPGFVYHLYKKEMEIYSAAEALMCGELWKVY